MPDDLLKRDHDHLLHPLQNRQSADAAHVWSAGRGAILIDSNGREFLDAIAGLWNVIIGHGRVELGRAASEQMDQLAYASAYSGSTNPQAIRLAERLAGICYPSINRFFFTCGGAEANESAFKTARWFWKLACRPEKTKIISRTWDYHGTTLAAMSATGLTNYWPMFEPRVPGFLHIESPYPYRFSPPANVRLDDSRTLGQIAADLLDEAIQREGAETVAAFIGEPVQGAAGAIVPPDDYWPRIRQICDRHDVLWIADEVVTGFGRTGDWFALSRYGVEPDMITFAKGITSGYFPLGGLGVSDVIASAIDSAPAGQTWMHAFTNSAHPVGCAVALANLDILERENLLARAADLGQRLLGRLRSLESHPNVGEVRGLGLLAAVELVADKSTRAEFPAAVQIGRRIHEATQQRGMFTRMRGDIYNFAPSYVTSESQIERMVGLLGESIDAVLGGG